ncbi:aminoglycoside nucleotidyltransferase [Pseudorhodoferax aquiterrae]|uniref:Aminoglycoside (3'') (9) adenylyltransferase n=1 Tax=Pseudorhodoferax aquiterrae TaxID=747304 RepID=A0ABQ3FYR6_9BURK|nr:aminoglycoside adenylyltransferase family protein [Pseudorhodoferax aquiterrae]GHC76898.1 aminoglycoside nucleotidyltransferase [Pseudorhodoferax aquiterrae]
MAIDSAPDTIAAQLAGVLALLQRQLGEQLRAVHLYGSAVDGGLQPGSDIDLMVSVAAPLPPEVRNALLQALLAHSAWPGSSAELRALEVTVVALPALRPWRYPPRRELQFGEWLRADLQAGRFEPPMADHDLAILLTKLRQHSLALRGPPAQDLFEPVPAADFRRALADTVAQWNAPPDWQGEERNILLALARIWFSACTGGIASKDDAAAWAADRLPAQHRACMQAAALAYRSGQDGAQAWRPEQVAATILFCKHAIVRELARTPVPPA